MGPCRMIRKCDSESRITSPSPQDESPWQHAGYSAQPGGGGAAAAAIGGEWGRQKILTLILIFFKKGNTLWLRGGIIGFRNLYYG